MLGTGNALEALGLAANIDAQDVVGNHRLESVVVVVVVWHGDVNHAIGQVNVRHFSVNEFQFVAVVRWTVDLAKVLQVNLPLGFVQFGIPSSNVLGNGTTINAFFVGVNQSDTLKGIVIGEQSKGLELKDGK